ncbi:protein-L-isoaspartate(D-aspartate) O-methyltransferase [Lysobacter sp. A6]|uniref:Protein-L-isoaspartate O-methyltransferase n=1 Tax=Noviluteimonas lactosilytica TaxID=2888523 RepID=A0ABS8JH70_9GAMM|nr:protein-L-isoaspartate(D-aspartate) O-methyltransferase [Lysobacter lactosilyticus]MCC8362956.1 protein-L-isoaspartate(D-aspartate) O-methyltransferase [Lysobacter lactosilyticus]
MSAFLVLGIAIAATCGASASPRQRDDARAADRRAMVEEIRGEHAATPIDRRVLDAIRRVPRHAFVPASQVSYAYDNRPLPIGYGQTISQPYIVALMTQLAAPETTHRVLEIGTGSGYQAAVLALLAGDVYTIEIIEPLAATAKERLSTYDNVRTRVGDGYYGWKEAAPFDAIVVTAAAESVPPPLIAQLAPGGRMVIPVGTSFFTQRLLLVTKDARGRVRTRSVLPVRFVPLTGDH